MKSSLSIIPPWIMSLVLYLKNHHTQGHLVFFLMLSSRICIVLHCTLRSVIHFEFIFVKDVRSLLRLNVFLHVDVQLSQHHLLKTIFAPLYCLCSFLKNQLPLCEFICTFSILFHWSVCLFFCQYYTVLITIGF